MVSADASIIRVHLRDESQPLTYDGREWSFDLTAAALQLTRGGRQMEDPVSSIWIPAGRLARVETEWAMDMTPGAPPQVLTKVEYEAKFNAKPA